MHTNTHTCKHQRANCLCIPTQSSLEVPETEQMVLWFWSEIPAPAPYPAWHFLVAMSLHHKFIFHFPLPITSGLCQQNVLLGFCLRMRFSSCVSFSSSYCMAMCWFLSHTHALYVYLDTAGQLHCPLNVPSDCHLKISLPQPSSRSLAVAKNQHKSHLGANLCQTPPETRYVTVNNHPSAHLQPL